jgi:hypothetical protein
MSFLREVFSEDGQGSASRVMMAFHALVGALAVLHVSIHHHAIPDAATMAGVTGFVSAPYAINKFAAGAASLAEAIRPKS